MGNNGHFKPFGDERLKPPYGQDKLKEMQVFTEAKKLEKHTLILTSSEKKYPKKYRITLCARMQNEAMDVVESLAEANDMELKRLAERDLRYLAQRGAIRSCRALIHHIELSFEMRLIDADSFTYWAKMANSVRNMTAAWHKSDRIRAERADAENRLPGTLSGGLS